MTRRPRPGDETAHHVRIFVASATDTDDERAAVRDVVDSLNHTLGDSVGRMADVWLWEERASAGPGEPQARINPELDGVDIVIAIFRSFFRSGTREEVERTIGNWRESRRPELMAYFHAGPMPKDRALVREWLQVDAFQSWLRDQEHTTWSYESLDDFREAVRRHLHKALERRWRPGPAPAAGSASGASAAETGAVTPSTSTDAVPSALDVTRYLDKVRSLHESLPIVGFETKVRVPLKLDDLYVPLRARADLRVTGDASFGGSEDAERALGAHGQTEVPLAEAFGLAKKLGGRRGLVILGDPGAGKTTFLRQLALCLALGRHADVGVDSDYLPVFLPLRALTDFDAGLTAFMEQELGRPELGLDADLARTLVRRGRLLVLLDGLDEVSHLGDRGTVSRRIEQARADMEDSLFVVTSRYAGYTEEARLSEQFLELHVRPLGKRAAAEFVQKWFRLVETTHATDKEQARLKADADAVALVERLGARDFKAAKVFELTRNPLLLTIICLVHRDRGSLPHRRERLYAESINVLLERWRAAKRLSLSADADTTRRILQPAALWMHRQGVRRATADELVFALQPALATVKWDKGDAREFLAKIRDESGLLTGWSDRTFGFLHLGFQEYLAAREIRRLHFEGDSSGLDEVAAAFGESWWREVLLLLLSLEEPSLFEPLMGRVVEQPAFGEDDQLVTECLEDAREFSARPFVEFLRREAESDDADGRKRQALDVLARKAPEVLAELGDVGDLRGRAFAGAVVPGVGVSGGVRAASGGGATDDRAGEAAAPELTEAARGGYLLVPIRGGRFLMGSPDDEPERSGAEGPQHEVVVPDFELGRCPVTNAEYARFLEATGHVEPSEWGDRRFNQPDQPVVGVSWHDAKAYCEWAGLVLPSEAMWEYACRAGTTTPFHWGETITTDQVNYNGNHPSAGAPKGEYRERTVPVMELGHNAWGLYQMHGNVFEWCEDTWHDSYDGAPADGSARVVVFSEDHRVYRGGSWNNSAKYARSAYRYCHEREWRDHGLGFRPARVATD